MKKLFLSLVAIVAIAGAIGTREVAQAAVNSNPDLRVAVACSPLTNSQTAVAGDPQLCRMKFTNYSAFPITDISISRPSVNTLVSRYAFNSPSLVCDNSGCAPFTLAPGETVYVSEEMVFNEFQDGRGRTKAFADGTQVIARPNKPTVYQAIHSWGYEQSSLP